MMMIITLFYGYSPSQEKKKPQTKIKADSDARSVFESGFGIV